MDGFLTLLAVTVHRGPVAHQDEPHNQKKNKKYCITHLSLMESFRCNFFQRMDSYVLHYIYAYYFYALYLFVILGFIPTSPNYFSGKSRSHTPESDVSLEPSERNPETFENEDARENAKNNNVSTTQLPKRTSMTMRGKAAASATTVTV